MYRPCPSLLANWKKILEAVLSVISAINWLNIGKTILTGVANGVKSMGSSMLNAFKGGFSSALNWIKSLPSQAVQWGKNLIQSFINGLTGKGGAVGAGAIAATAGATIAKTASGNDWSSVWADANADVADSAQSMAEVVVPAYTKSGDAATKAAKKTKAAAQAAETLLWSLQDAGHTDTTNALGKVTIQTTELTEHLRKGSEEYDRLTRTVTESGKEMVNGVVKNYKTVTKYVTENGKTTAQTQKVYEEIAATVAKTVTSTTDSVVNGIATSTKTITETLTDKTTTQKQVITETYNDIVDGALVTVERVKTIAADGVPQITEEIKKASANSFDGLVKGWQDEAHKGVVGTFSTLVNAVKKQDWQSVGEWVLSTLYNGLAPQAKQLIDDFGKNLIQQVNNLLGKGVSAVSNGLWDMGGDLAKGLTSGFAGRAHAGAGPWFHPHRHLSGTERPAHCGCRCHQHRPEGRADLQLPGDFGLHGHPDRFHRQRLCGDAGSRRGGTVPHRIRCPAGAAHDRGRRGPDRCHCGHRGQRRRRVQAQDHARHLR